MMELAEDIPVTLVIKAPNQRLADQTVDCMLGWTIKKLKQHLEAVYPSKPKHNEQRLIYSGRLLQDHLTLKEILRQYDTSEVTNKHTVHLVCSTLMDSSSSSTSVISGNSSEDLAKSQSTRNPPTSGDTVNSENRNPIQAEGLRYRGHVQSTCNQGNASTYLMPPATSMNSDVIPGYPGQPCFPQQYAWMMQQQQQQMYAQYMMNYMQYYHSIYSPGQPFSYSQFMQQPVTAASPALQQQQPPPAAEAAAQNNAAAAGAGQPNVRMNAQGGVEEDDEEGEPRDWLHHAYFFMRFLMFMAILFFYSNLTRFAVVFTGFFVIYVLQKIRNYWQKTREQERRQQEQRNSEQQQQQQEQESQQQQQEQPNGGDTELQAPAAHESSPVQNEEQPAVEAEPGRTTRAFVFICNTVQAFFTSLLPTTPELLQQN